MFIEDDKASWNQMDKDHSRIAEISRYAHDTIRKCCPFLNKSQLENIRIPAIHVAGSQIDYFLTKWLYKPEHFYLFMRLKSYTTHRKIETLKEAAQRMWNVLEIIKNNVNIIYEAFQESKRPDFQRHTYVMRSHIDKPPPTKTTIA